MDWTGTNQYFSKDVAQVTEIQIQVPEDEIWILAKLLPCSTVFPRVSKCYDETGVLKKSWCGQLE